MSKKTDKTEELFHTSLDMLDSLHAAIVDFAELSGVDVDREPIVSDDGAKLPRTQFVVAGDDAPERGGVAVDTRMTLALTGEQAQELMFELARSMREQESDKEEIEIDIDGRLMVKRGAAADIRHALDKAD